MAIKLAPGQTVVTVEQDKDSQELYSFELAELLPPNDFLATVTWMPSAGISVKDFTNNDTDAVVLVFGGEVRTWYALTATWTTQSGATDQFVVRVYIKEDAELETGMGSALFPNKFTIVAQLKRDGLLLAAQTHFSGVTLKGSYIWDKLRAAEADVARTLRVKFTPTKFFSTQPTQEQIDALAGLPWELDEGYDYDPSLYSNDSWGLFTTHSTPLISVQRLKFAYPAFGGPSFDIPLDWLQLDRKYGHVRIVPMASSAAAIITPYMMQLISVGRMIPNMIQIEYTAGLQNVAADYPDLIDAVKKMAVLKIVEDTFLPQSGSISADGLSQSMSIDMSKYEDAIDRIINGRKGSNGGLRAAIHGVTLAVM